MPRLKVIVLLLVLTVPFMMGTGVRAQETPAASPVALPALLQQATETFNGGDPAAVAALYAEDGIHEDVPAGVRVQGREAITAYVETVFGQLDDFRFEPVFGWKEGNVAVLEYSLTGTDPASGQPVTYRGVIVAEYDGDLIRRSTDYYDLASILSQIGLLDLGEAPADGTPTS